MALTQMPKPGDKVRPKESSYVYDVAYIDAYGHAVITLPDGFTSFIPEEDFDHFELISKGADNVTKPTTRAEYWADKRREIEGATYTAEQRQARKGERIVIVEPCEHDSEDYERGDIFIVDKVDSAGVTTTTGNIVYHEEYEVLPSAMAEKRHAKPGERIVVVAPDINAKSYEQGDVITASSVDSHGDVFAEINGRSVIVYPREYEVLPERVTDANRHDAVEACPDNVNSPAHYTQGGTEVIDIIAQIAGGYSDGFEAYAVGNAIKYLARAPHKHATIDEDIAKAIRYLQFIQERRADVINQSDISDASINRKLSASS